MRRLVLASCLICVGLPAYAAGNVLLPSSNSSASSDSGVSAAAMGLSVTPSATSAAAPETPMPTPAPPPAQPTGSAPALSYPAIPASAPPATYKMPSLSDMITPVDQASAKNLLPGAIPTQVIKQPDMSQSLSQVGNNLPYGFTISFSGRSVFGSKDVQQISTTLGLNRDQIASSCSLSLTGVLQTSKGAYMVDSGLKTQASLKYDGTIQSYLLAARAMCAPAGKLPPGSGLISEIGGRYMVPLQPIECPAPNRQTPGLVVTYDGSGKSQCDYQ